ncbi:hypothetical protein [Ruegeria arenilitoris]|uniref:hypothetical protein n=1 Tax=Ruegeria arenilitoris TaxID=1173585 RepID=UPI00147C5136|nr:hypothetical protein [Ruegeria arenilitoris]
MNAELSIFLGTQSSFFRQQGSPQRQSSVNVAWQAHGLDREASQADNVASYSSMTDNCIARPIEIQAP